MSAKLSRSIRKADKALDVPKVARLVPVVSTFGTGSAVGAASEGNEAEDNGPVTIAQTDTAAQMQLVAAGHCITAGLAAPIQLFQPITVPGRSSSDPIWPVNGLFLRVSYYFCQKFGWNLYGERTHILRVTGASIWRGPWQLLHLLSVMMIVSACTAPVASLVARRRGAKACIRQQKRVEPTR